jgi:hypothetical protein
MEIRTYFVENWEIILPFTLIILETLLRKIPTYENISLISKFNSVLDLLIGNNSLTSGKNGREVGVFNTIVQKLKK